MHRRQSVQNRAYGHRPAVTTWVVPNPSGLNAHYQLPDLARIYGALRPLR